MAGPASCRLALLPPSFPPGLSASRWIPLSSLRPNMRKFDSHTARLPRRGVDGPRPMRAFADPLLSTGPHPWRVGELATAPELSQRPDKLQKPFFRIRRLQPGCRRALLGGAIVQE